MHKTFLTALLLSLGCTVCFSQVLAPELEDPTVNSINRLPARAYSMPLASVKDALTNALEPSTPYVQSLNGDWKISWVGDPSRRIKDFYRVDFDDSSWQTIDVPSCVETRGFGNPIYTNVTYPHQAEPPIIRDYNFGTEDYNPVSSYRTEFTIPESWAGRDVILRFDGVYSAYYVWVNGQKVGYAEDSKLPDEFDITPYLKSGKNLLAVEVYRWCDGSYLEDQDMFRFSGIYRDVSLIAMPKERIEDFFVRTTLINNYTAAKVNLSITASAPGITAELYDATNKVVGRFKGAENSITLRNPHLWSAEDPYLYTLVIKAGKDIRSTKVGLKQVELINNAFHINGKLVKFKGVNRHEHSALNGRSVSMQEMLDDILLMKKYNINTVRTSHYPDHHSWYDLCDKYGIYLVAEANVEGHGMGYQEKGLGRFPEWETPIVERNVNNVKNYRNHPSIFMWSLGNETGHGNDFIEARDAIKGIDPTRPIHWERGNEDMEVDSRMYASVDWLYERGNTPKPFFMCEYAHAMGNAIGNLEEYWEAFYSSDVLSGGCIWDWVDQSLIKKTTRYDANGDPILIMAYGGDYDELPNSGPFCCNGVIKPDRKVTAKLVEVGHVYRQIVVKASSEGKATIWNRFSFTNTGEYEPYWALLEDGVKVAEGIWNVPSVSPSKTVEVSLPETGYSFKSDKEYFLNVEFRLKNATLWANKGHVVASDQILLSSATESPEKSRMSSSPNIKEDGDLITVSSKEYEAVFSKKTGTLTSLKVGGKQVLATNLHGVTGPRLTCMRALGDNDIWLNRGNSPFRAFGLTQLNYQAKGITVTNNADGSIDVKTYVDVTGSKGAGFDHESTYSFNMDGTITIKNDIMPYGHMPEALPRLGLSLILDKSLEHVKWYGRGPSENYIDRCTGSFIGVYESTVTDLYEDYTRPQDNGYRGDIRWIALTDSAGKGVKFESDSPLFAQALHYDWEDLMYARHRNGEERRNDIKPAREEVCLNLDLRQLGLGGASCGPRTLDKYIFPIQKESYSITVSPYQR